MNVVVNGRKVLNSNFFALKIIVAVGFFYGIIITVANGDFVSQVTAHKLARYCDLQAPTWYSLYGNAASLSPSYQALMKTSLLTFGANVIFFVNKLGLSHDYSVAFLVVLVRATSFISLSTLFVFFNIPLLLSLVASAFLFSQQLGHIYGYMPFMAITGEFTTSVFLLSIVLLVMYNRNISAGLWCLQGWIHPITFFAWAPAYLALLIKSTSLSPLRKYLCFGLLFLGPLAAGGVFFLAEKGGIFFPGVDSSYWDIVYVRVYHAVFRGIDGRFHLPSCYISYVVFLVLISNYKKLPQKVRSIDLILSGLGGGMFLLYYFFVETQASVMANIAMPLRFETVLLPVIFANLLFVMIYDNIFQRLFGLVFFVGYFLHPDILLFIWVLPLLFLFFQGFRRVHLCFVALFTVSLQWFLIYENCPYSMPQLMDIYIASLRHVGLFLVCGTIASISIAVILARFRLVGIVGQQNYNTLLMLSVFTYLFLCVPIANAPMYGPSVNMFVKEVQSIIFNKKESSHELDAINWIKLHVPQNDTVLVSPNTFINLAGVPNTTLTMDFLGLAMYTPQYSRLIESEVSDVYGYNLSEMRKNNQRFDIFLTKGWLYAQAKYITNQQNIKYRYAIEESALSRVPNANIVFENSVFRVYKLHNSNNSSITHEVK